MAFEAWYFNSEEFASGGSIPYSNVVQGAGSEEFRVSSGECNVVDALVMASVSEFRLDFISVAPVDSCL